MPDALPVLGFVTLQRLVELWWSARNEQRLRARGAQEAGARHYPFIVALHVLWLAGLWIWAWPRPANWWLVAAYAVLQIARVWVIATLGERWTTRIIVLPGAPLVRAGPYRFLKHPNYLVVAIEIALLAQLDRAPDYESGGREFESLRARHPPLAARSRDQIPARACVIFRFRFGANYG